MFSYNDVIKGGGGGSLDFRVLRQLFLVFHKKKTIRAK